MPVFRNEGIICLSSTRRKIKIIIMIHPKCVMASPEQRVKCFPLEEGSQLCCAFSCFICDVGAFADPCVTKFAKI